MRETPRPSQSLRVYRACRAEHCWKSFSSVAHPFLRKRAGQAGRVDGSRTHGVDANAPILQVCCPCPHERAEWRLLWRYRPCSTTIPTLFRLTAKRQDGTMADMRGCNQCEEFERLMEEAAREHWDVIHRYREALDSEQGRPAAEDLLRASKSAKDQAE